MIGNSIEEMQVLVNSFNKQQLTEALYWMILGDGCIEKKDRGNYILSIVHSQDHWDYITWKSMIIERLTKTTYFSPFKGSGYSQGTIYVRVRSKAHPWFTKMRKRLYKPGGKTIDPMALSLLGPIGLSILYQDDGSLNYSTDAGTNVLLHKLNYSFFELEQFAKKLVDKYGIIFRLNRVNGKGKGFRLRLRAKDVDKFFELIEPYIVPSMEYKIVRGGKKIV